MSATVERATRRELRRAVGERAVTELEQTQAAVRELSNRMALVGMDVVKQHQHVDRLEHQLAWTVQVITEHDERARSFIAMSFRQRLRWLVLGR